jgi:hypothetical protein
VTTYAATVSPPTPTLNCDIHLRALHMSSPSSLERATLAAACVSAAVAMETVNVMVLPDVGRWRACWQPVKGASCCS